jgi:hypothetical protein
MSQRRFANAFIVVCVTVQLVLLVSCYWRDAKFFGWQMFSRPLVYEIRVETVAADGVRTRIDPAVYRPRLSGFAHGDLSPRGQRLFMRGREFLLGELSRLPGYLCRFEPLAAPVRVELTVVHRDVVEPGATRDTYASECL